MDVRDNIRKYIQDKGLTRSVMATRANMTPVKLSAVLNKRRKLEVSEFFNLCEAMGVTAEEIRYYRSESA